MESICSRAVPVRAVAAPAPAACLPVLQREPATQHVLCPKIQNPDTHAYL